MSNNAVFPNRPTRELVVRAQILLGLSHRKFGKALGASERTAARWAAGHSSLSVTRLCELAALVYPHDVALASAIAEAASETLPSLGLAVAPSASPPLAAHLAADLVVYAAADAAGAPPRAARAALLAAFARARELGLSVDEVEKALAAR